MAGESIFLTTYQSTKDNAEIAFGSSFPGKFLPIELQEGQNFYHSEKCFSCCGRYDSVRTLFP